MSDAPTGADEPVPERVGGGLRLVLRLAIARYGVSFPCCTARPLQAGTHRVERRVLQDGVRSSVLIRRTGSDNTAPRPDWRGWGWPRTLPPLVLAALFWTSPTIYAWVDMSHLIRCERFCSKEQTTSWSMTPMRPSPCTPRRRLSARSSGAARTGSGSPIAPRAWKHLEHPAGGIARTTARFAEGVCRDDHAATGIVRQRVPMDDSLQRRRPVGVGLRAVRIDLSWVARPIRRCAWLQVLRDLVRVKLPASATATRTANASTRGSRRHGRSSPPCGGRASARRPVGGHRLREPGLCRA